MVMKKYERLVYIILAIIICIVVLGMLLIHTFNNTKVDGTTTTISTITTSSKYIVRGD